MQTTRSRLLLRIAAGLFAFFALGHTIGMFQPSRSRAEDAVFDAMQTFRFPIMGFTRSHWQFYQGFGFLLSINLLLLAAFCWRLASLSSTQPSEARALVLVIFLASIAITVLSWTYFFLAPAVVSTALAIVLGMTVIALRNARAV